MTVSLETDNPVTFQKNAFKNCVGLKTFYVKSDFTVSTSEKDILNGCTSIENIGVRSLGEETDYVKGLLGGTIPSLTELHVGYLNYVPDNFCSDFIGLKTVSVDEIEKPVVGSRAFRGCTSLKNFSVPTKIVSVGEEAFKGTAIEEFDGELLEYVGNGAFASNPAITSFTFNENFTSVPEEVLSDCTALKTVTIPATCTRIAPRAFRGCTALETLALPEGVKSIAESAFTKCTSLVDVTLPDTLVAIGSYAFSGCSAIKSFVVPDSVTNVGVGTLSACSGLSELTVPYVGKTKDDTAGIAYIFSTRLNSFVVTDIPESLKKVTVTNGEIYDGVFSGAKNIERIEFGAFNSRIGARAFYGCSALRSVRVNGEITSIGDYAFCNCASYEKFSVFDTVTEMGKGVFAGCSALKELNMPFLGANAYEQTAALGYSFANVYGNYTIPLTLRKVTVNGGYIGANAFNGCSGIEEVVLTGEIYSIGSGAFKNCTALKYLTLPSPLISIGASAFENCYNLISADLPASLNRIEDSAFARCYTIKSIALPERLQYIGNGAFSECLHLYKVYNNSSLSLARGDAYTAGGVAQYALSVRGKGETIPSATVNGFLFMLSDDETPIAYLIGYNGVETTSFVPDAINFNGTEYAAYELAPRVFWYPGGDKNLESVSFGNALTAIRYRAFYGNDTIARVTAGKSLGVIENEAFIGCIGLKSFELSGGSDVKKIGDNAFESCVSLTSLTFSDGSTVRGIGQSVFNNCTSLSSLILPDGLTTIGNSAFGNCSSLKTVSFPSTLDSMGAYAFYGCSSLTKASLPQNLTEIPYGAFADCAALEGVSVSDSLTVLGRGAFSGCVSLKEFSYGSAGNLTISAAAFSDCTSLRSFSVSPGTVEIAENAFANCRSLKSVYAQNTELETIGDMAFSDCTSLENFIAPYSLVSIGRYAFDGCNSLGSVIIPGNLEYLGDSAFVNCTSLNRFEFAASGELTVSSNAFSGCVSLSSIALPSGVTNVGSNAFYGCTSLTDVDFPDNLKTIGASAFYGCTSLRKLTIPAKVTEIGNSAFYGCTSLSSLDALSYSAFVSNEAFRNCTALETARIECRGIGVSAFADCTSLESFYMLNGSNVSSYAFSGCTSLELVSVPATLYSIAGGAFSGCTSLFEIYNLSRLTFVIGTSSYGGIARYAYKIHTNASDAAMAKAKTDNVCFVKPDDKWILARYVNPSSDLRLDAVNTDSGIVDDFKVVGAVFKNVPLTGIYFGRAVSEIDNGAFSNRTELSKVEFAQGGALTVIPDEAFAYCTGLSQVVFSDSITDIGERAFSNDSLSRTERLPLELRNIGAQAFAYTGLKCVYIPKHVVNFGTNAFIGCTQLIEVYNFTDYQIKAGSNGYGNVAGYAVIVNTDAEAPRVVRLEVSSCVFLKFHDSWHLYSTPSYYTLTLPDASRIGSDVKSYDVLDSAIYGYRIVVPTCVTSFAENAFMSNSLTFFYRGTASEWQNLIKGVAVSVSEVYYYAECVHKEGQWTYDAHGNIDTNVKTFALVSDAEPTCTESGKRVYRCPTCGEERTETYGKPKGHDYDENYICKDCGQEDPDKPPQKTEETDMGTSDEENPSRKKDSDGDASTGEDGTKSGRTVE